MDDDLQEIERILSQITNSTATTDHLIQHIQSFYPADKQTLPSKNTQLKNVICVSFLGF